MTHPNRRRTDPLPNNFVPWYKKPWRDFVNHLRNTKAPMGLVYLGAAITLFGWWGVQHQQEVIVNSQRETDLRSTAQALYAQQLQQWASDTSAYELCLDSVSRADLNRQQWLDIAEGLDSIGANEFADRVRNGPVLSSEPRLDSECGPDPGPPPEPPSSLNEGLLLGTAGLVQFTTVPH